MTLQSGKKKPKTQDIKNFHCTTLMYRHSTSKMNTNAIQSIIQILSIGRSEMHTFELAHL